MTPSGTPLTVTFEDDVAGIVNRSTASVTYTLRFSESITGLEIGDLTLANATISDLSGAGDSWTLMVTPRLNVGSASIGIKLKAAAVVGSSGATNDEAIDTSQAIDTRAPAPPKLVTGAGFETTVDPQVELVTTMGSVVVELDPDRAPVTVANMLAYVNMGFYDGTLFHRVIPNFVIQGGGYASGLVSYSPLYSPIALESDNGLANLRGTLAMARTSMPDSATTQFYVNLVDNSALDYRGPSSPGYTVFGKVVSGLEVVDSIAGVPTTSVGSFAGVPVADVTVLSAHQTVAGSANSTTGHFAVEGLEAGARWAYSLNGGLNWAWGSGGDLYVPEGSYAPDAIRVAQLDSAGNQSFTPGTYDSTLVVDLPDDLVGTAGADTLSGGFANDRLAGLGGDDVLSAGGGDDMLFGGGGDDVLAGGSGTDTAIYAGARAGFTVAKQGNAFTITDKTGAEGTDTLTTMEKLQFSDKLFDLVNPPRTSVPDYGKDGGFLFDPVFYLLNNPELVPTVGLDTALQNYRTVGAAQGKAPNSWFSADYYANKWADLKPLQLDDATLFAHYNLYGVWEGRSGGPKFELFDGNRYLAENPDVAAYVDANVEDFLGSRSNGAIAHFIIYGNNEQRVAYDTAGAAVDMGYIL